MVTDHPSPCLALSSFTGSAAAFAAVTLAAKGTGENRVPLVLAVTPGLPEADTLAANLHSLEKESGVRILEFPPSLEDDRTTTAARLKTVAAIDAYMTRPYPLAVVAPFASQSPKLGRSVCFSMVIARSPCPVSLKARNSHLKNMLVLRETQCYGNKK